MEVLVVDDNEVVADSLAFLLDCHGHRTTVAHDGETALSLVCYRAFELVLLDENLPGIKGSAVARAIINMPLGDRPIVVSMTGDSDNGELARLFDVCLQKPFPVEALFQVIDDAESCGVTSARLAA
jgi:CheY-like chemotaxis protein